MCGHGPAGYRKRCGGSIGRLAGALLCGISFLAVAAHAQDATWLMAPATSDWNTAANWTPASVPTNTAIFGASNTTSLTFSAVTTSINTLQLNAGAPAYTFTVPSNSDLSINGTGIVVSGGSVAITSKMTTIVDFNNSSTAGSATINNGTLLNFNNNSTAGNAVINNKSGGAVAFNNNSTAGSATIINDASELQFNDNSTAGNATITNSQFFVFFGGHSTAGNATINNSFAVQFNDNSTAGNATINNSGAVSFFTNGPTGNNQVSVGSIAGAGTYYLGSDTLTVGSNNLNTTVSGAISDCNVPGSPCAGGALVKVGSGTLTLSGSNTYVGGTTLASGTLTLGNNDALGFGTLAMATGTTLSFLNTANFTIANPITISGDPTFTPPSGTTQTLSGVISDGISAGTPNMNGPGTLILTNTNTYTGATTISSGILALSGFGSIAQSSQVALATAATFDISQTTAGASIKTLADTALGRNGTVSLGGQTLTITNGSTTFSGVIKDGGIAGGAGGSLNILRGTQTFAGIDTYTGTTTINGGALALSGIGSIASSSGVSVNSTGTVDISQTTAGASITSLSGNGAVALGNQTLTVNVPGMTMFGGVIADGGIGGGAGGSLVKVGIGMLALTGDNTYTGTTTISAGTLLLGDGGTTGSIFGNVIDNATLAFNRSDTVTFGNLISGSGGLTQWGPGTLILSNADTYTGATNVNGGTLEVDGSIANTSSVTVNAGATLSGIGIVDPATTTIMNGGALAPGNAANPTGTLTLTGNLAFQSAALYLVQVTPATASKTNVSGTATLAGTVFAVFAPGAYAGKQYDILHSAGLGGTTFAGLSDNIPAGLTTTLSYSATDVFLNLTAQLGNQSALNQNQQNVANAINGFFNNGGALPPGFVNLFGLTGPGLPTALAQLSGEDATDAERSAFDLMNEFLGLMLDPFVAGRNSGPAGGALGFAPDQAPSFPPDVALAYASLLKAPPQPQTFDRGWTAGWTAWGAGFGGSNHANGDLVVGSSNVTTSTHGYAGGMDYHLSPDTVVGFALSGGGVGWDLAQGLGTGRSDAFQSGVYGVTHAGPAYLAAGLAFANNWFTTNRTALGDQLTARFQGQSYGARLEGGYRFAAPVGHERVGVTPYAAVQAQDFHTPTYSETDLTGGGFGLSHAAMNGTDTRSELGGRFDDLTALGTMPLVLRAKLAWAHDWVSNPGLNASFESLPGTGFTVNGAPIPKNAALTTAGAQLWLTTNWSLLAKFDGEFAKGSQTYAGTGTVRYSW
jgi:autotransporter-associated beta strand protein